MVDKREAASGWAIRVRAPEGWEAVPDAAGIRARAVLAAGRAGSVDQES